LEANVANKIGKHIYEQKTISEASLLAKKNVVGVGIGKKVIGGKVTKNVGVVAFVEKKWPINTLSWEELLPSSLGDVPLDVVEVGKIEAQSYTDRVRPVIPGYSAGHYKITAGTFGATVYKEGVKMMLSNNHVFANSNDAAIGDPIYQPGPIDGGDSSDKVATLYQFIPIDFGEGGGDTCPFADSYSRFGAWLAKLLGKNYKVNATRTDPTATNLVDAALALPISGVELSDKIVGIGEVEDTTDFFLGQKVQKAGRTTELTTGEISHVSVTVQVNYGNNKIAKFENQIMAGAMSQGGDSGSLLVDRDTRALHPRAVGLLFAGSPQVTIFNPIQHVIDALGITFDD
jgi:hypothetical protein